MRQRLPDILENMRNSLKKMFTENFSEHRDQFDNEADDVQDAQNFTDTVSAQTGKAYRAAKDGLKGLGSDALKRTAQEFNDTLPFIERAGYKVSMIDVGLGLSPKIISVLQYTHDLNDEEQADLLSEIRNNSLQHTILSSLFAASALREKLRFRHFKFSALELDISVLPTVSLRFLPDDTLQNHTGNDQVTDKANNFL